MERRLKERLVGAAILVVLIVLVVPELLSGPSGNGSKPAATSISGDLRSDQTRTVTVDLNTKRTMALDAPQEDAATVGAESPADSSPPVPQTPAAAPAVSARTSPVQPAPVPAAPPAASTAIENQASSPKSWTLQLGSFSSRANADQLLRTVKARNSPAYLLTSGTGKSLRYRVRVGPLADRAAAERMRAKLKSEGHAASVVAP